MRHYILRFPSGNLASAFIYDTYAQAREWRYRLKKRCDIVEVRVERLERVISAIKR